jgi:hypothetical protein
MTPLCTPRAHTVLSMVAFVCLLAGCGDDSPSTGDACADDCMVDGGPDSGPIDCEVDDDCAGGTCDDGQCSGPECSDDDACESGVCTSGGECALATCEDGVSNGDESDDDCGGPECDPCDLEASCTEHSDCASGVCAAMTCVAPSCTDGLENGTETAVDCGGNCEPCDDGEACTADADCGSGVCDDTCLPAACGDDTQNGDETDIDCGGTECEPCGESMDCVEDTDCESSVCSDETCLAATCDDETANGDETDADCGGSGSCDRCARGDACADDSDCATGHCEADECVAEPTAAFTLTTLYADVGQELTATSNATADSPIVSIEYDWGAGFGSDATHTFEAVGDFMVTQRVTDDFGFTATTSRMVNVFRPVKLSTTDATSNVYLSDDGLGVGIYNRDDRGGVRSDTGVAAGSGAWYFEVDYIGRPSGYHGVTVMSGTADFTGVSNVASEVFFVSLGGQGWYGGNLLFNLGPLPTFGFVVDYRGANPIVHVIAHENGDSTVLASGTLTVTTPVFASFGGIINSHGLMASFNFGSDTENHPFTLDPVAALNDAGQESVASALVLGFGGTRARPASAAPVIDAPDDLTVDVNTPVTLNATATDAEDGSLTEQLHWENMAESFYARTTSDGGSFSFTPVEIGRYPIRVHVKDSVGLLAERTVMVTVTGTLQQFEEVRLITDANTGAEIVVSPDGLSAQYHAPAKMGIRANQGNYGRFWYFEMRRLITPAENIGGGLVIARGSLNPMTAASMQPSVQVNFLGGLWRQLINEYSAATSSSGYFGFAVDYRGNNPIVYLIVDNVVLYSLTLDEVWLPIYPMLYGNPTNSVEPYDNRLNVGGTPFQNNPVTALTNAGVSTVGFEPYWGESNAP